MVKSLFTAAAVLALMLMVAPVADARRARPTAPAGSTTTTVATHTSTSSTECTVKATAYDDAADDFNRNVLTIWGFYGNGACAAGANVGDAVVKSAAAYAEAYAEAYTSCKLDVYGSGFAGACAKALARASETAKACMTVVTTLVTDGECTASSDVKCSLKTLNVAEKTLTVLGTASASADSRLCDAQVGPGSSVEQCKAVGFAAADIFLQGIAQWSVEIKNLIEANPHPDPECNFEFKAVVDAIIQETVTITKWTDTTDQILDNSLGDKCTATATATPTP